MKAEERAIQIWDYVEGQCNSADATRIAQLIATDEEWQAEYLAALAMHNALQQVETEQPSMRFTQNVMDVISAQQVAPSVKRYVNPVIVKGIAAFFIAVLVAVVGYTLANTNWQAGPNIPVNLFNSKTLGMIVGGNIILLLVVVDRLVNKRRLPDNVI